jgi:hypothetical protein
MSPPLDCVWPDCGHDGTGDDADFGSGGGWRLNHSISDGIYIEEYACPVCEHVVHREERRGLFG